MNTLNYIFINCTRMHMIVNVKDISFFSKKRFLFKFVLSWSSFKYSKKVVAFTTEERRRSSSLASMRPHQPS